MPSPSNPPNSGLSVSGGTAAGNKTCKKRRDTADQNLVKKSTNLETLAQRFKRHHRRRLLEH